MQVSIEQQLFCGVSSVVDLPDGKTWQDVGGWYVKWDSLFVRFKNSPDYIEIPLDSDQVDAVDWKRPLAATVYEATEDGCADWERELDRIKG